MREDHYAAWAIAGLGGIILLYVLGFDLWAHFTGHKTISKQGTEWLFDLVIGPFVVWVLGGGFLALAWHLLNVRSRQ
jgi:hypothetical protein